MAAGVSDGFLYGERSRPAVLYLTDIGGIREATRGMAERLAEQGFAVLMPNVFYRNGNPPFFTGEYKVGDEAFMKRVRELAAGLTPEAMDDDLARYLDFLPSAGAAAGFCFTGGMALRAAAVRPRQIHAVASFHGGHLYTDAPTSPHLLLPRIKARLYFGHAKNDRGMPAEAIEKLNAALAEWGGQYESEIYEAHHGWTVPDHPAYNEAQAERAFSKFVSFLRA
jgi:carboxymethylenebutenolidase